MILTNELDVAADFLVRELDRRRQPVVRLNVERLADWQVEMSPGCGWRLARRQGTLESRECPGVWWRRPDLSFLVQSGSLEKAEEAVIQDQWRAFLLGLASVPGPRWVSSPRAIRAAEDKAWQLSLARQLGMAVPETLWTNSLLSARRFLEENDGEMAAKSVTSAWWEREGAGWFVFAGRVQSENLPSASGLAASPVALQAPIDPKRDVRVTVVGSQVFAAIRVAESENAARPDVVPLDWRRGSDQPWVSHVLPDKLGLRCAELVASLDLHFGAIDLLLDPSGRYWFCEINPNGEWGWLQRSGLPIAEALADFLLDD